MRGISSLWMEGDSNVQGNSHKGAFFPGIINACCQTKPECSPFHPDRSGLFRKRVWFGITVRLSPASNENGPFQAFPPHPQSGIHPHLKPRGIVPRHETFWWCRGISVYEFQYACLTELGTHITYLISLLRILLFQVFVLIFSLSLNFFWNKKQERCHHIRRSIRT